MHFMIHKEITDNYNGNQFIPHLPKQDMVLLDTELLNEIP